MSDVELDKLLRAREAIAPEKHQDISLANTSELWWGIADGEELIATYGREAVQAAHDAMLLKTEVEIASIRNLGGYFHRVVKNQTGTSEPLGRTMPQLARKIDDDAAQDDADARRLEKRRYAENTPGTLEYRMKHGDKNDD